jgi:protein-disulfide isomerase
MRTETAAQVGDPAAKFTIVEFFDPNCIHCKASVPSMLAWVDQNPGTRILFRELPVITRQSAEVAKIPLALAQQGLYRAWLEKVSTFKGLIDPSVALEIAKGLGADMSRLDASIKDPATTKIIADNLELGANLAIDGTPAFIVGQSLLIGDSSTIWMTDYAAQQGAPLPKASVEPTIDAPAKAPAPSSDAPAPEVPAAPIAPETSEGPSPHGETPTPQ